MGVTSLVEFHAIDAPARLGFLKCNPNTSIDGNSDRGLSIDDGMLAEENALARRARDDHVKA